MILSDISLPIPYTEEMLFRGIRKKAQNKNLKIKNVTLLKRSIDARKKPNLRYVLTVKVNEPDPPYRLPEKSCLRTEKRTVVVGAGPAGLFAALTLLRAGIPVLLLERGEDVEHRKETVSAFWKTGRLNPDSNVQFGEGGAGTFSDGKLNTQTHSPLNDEVLRIFTAMGAKEEILYDQKPHIGTDALLGVMKTFRETIIRLGGEVRFHATLTDLDVKVGRLSGIIVNENEKIPCDSLVLALGHSARDTFSMLKKRGLHLEQKAFALGIRIEHPEKMITEDQYGTLDYECLGAAPYKLTYKTKDGRGVYTFCMCPGGYVVNASSEPEKLCINGMSYAARDGENSNSALVVQVLPSDFPDSDVLSGVEFQRSIEKKAFFAGEGKIPVQILADFMKGVKTTRFGAYKPMMKGQYAFADLNEILPPYIAESLKEAIPEFGKRIRGFDREDAILSCVEARTSSPVRIVRDENGESNVKGIFPAGEGAGYSGGILSSAKDGLEIAGKIIESVFGRSAEPTSAEKQ